MNPCRCGFLGDSERECRCRPDEVDGYRARISGPLLDRIDLHLEVPSVDYKELTSKAEGEPSAAIRERVQAAREIQMERYALTKGSVTNSTMPPKMRTQHCQLDAESSGLLEQAMGELHLSARAHDRILKVSRTLADLEGAENISANHLLEAIQYRTLDRNLWG